MLTARNILLQGPPEFRVKPQCQLHSLVWNMYRCNTLALKVLLAIW